MNKFKVLIADSSPSVRHFIKYSLQDHFPSVEFEVATNGKNIKKRLENTLYDIILYDRDMPMLQGDELLEWLRHHERLKNISFIMISGNTDESSLKRAIALGADAYLIKPLLMDPLVSKVREIFARFERDKFDRRRNERIKCPGGISLKFASGNNRGKLINISMGGVLGLFDREGPLPHILDKIEVSVHTEGNRGSIIMEGEIIRIQVVDTFAGPKQIQIAVKFYTEVSAEKKQKLAQLVASFKP